MGVDDVLVEEPGELEPLAQPMRSIAEDTGSSTRQADNATRTVRWRAAGLCAHASIAAIESSSARRVRGSVLSTAGGSVLGIVGAEGTSIPLPVVVTLTVNVPGVAGVAVTVEGDELQLDKADAPEQLIVALTWSVEAPPVAVSCRL